MSAKNNLQLSDAPRSSSTVYFRQIYFHVNAYCTKSFVAETARAREELSKRTLIVCSFRISYFLRTIREESHACVLRQALAKPARNKVAARPGKCRKCFRKTMARWPLLCFSRSDIYCISMHEVQRIERNKSIRRHIPLLSTSNDHLTYGTDFHGHVNPFFHRRIDPCCASLNLIHVDSFKRAGKNKQLALQVDRSRGSTLNGEDQLLRVFMSYL